MECFTFRAGTFLCLPGFFYGNVGHPGMEIDLQTQADTPHSRFAVITAGQTSLRLPDDQYRNKKRPSFEGSFLFSPQFQLPSSLPA